MRTSFSKPNLTLHRFVAQPKLRTVFLPSVSCLLPSASCLLPSASCLPPSVSCLPPPAYLSSAFCLLPTVLCRHRQSERSRLGRRHAPPSAPSHRGGRFAG